MASAVYSPAEIQVLRSEIDIASVPGNIKDLFCKNWPLVKEVLQALQGILKNPIAKAAIGVVITAGDAVSGLICK